MKNFEFEHEGKKLWYSRSLACNAIILRKTEYSVEVLACKRGYGAEFNKGKWNVPGGFIDFNETAKQCAIREAFEETGVQLTEDKLWFTELDTIPRGKRQTMLAVYVGIFTEEETKDWQFSLEHCEPGEIAEVKWIDVLNLKDYTWTNNQIELIDKAVLTYCDIWKISNSFKDRLEYTRKHLC